MNSPIGHESALLLSLVLKSFLSHLLFPPLRTDDPFFIFFAFRFFFNQGGGGEGMPYTLSDKPVVVVIRKGRKDFELALCPGYVTILFGDRT